MVPSSQPPHDSPPPQPPPERSPGLLYGLLVLIFRLLLLGVGGSLAVLVGIGVALWRPGTVPDRPMLEVLFRQVSAWRSGEWYAPVEPESTLPPAIPRLESLPAPSDVNVSDAEPDSGETETLEEPLPLDEEEREAVATTVAELQTEVEALGDRLQDLEVQLDGAPRSGPVEERLRRLERRLDPASAESSSDETAGLDETADVDGPAEQPADPPARASETEAAPITTTSTPSLSPDTLRVTLPSDALFQTNDARLVDGAETLLDDIATELQTYPTATIRIGVHTAPTPDSTDGLPLSFARSQQIRDVLAPQLGPSYRLVAIGYGSTRPLILSTDLSAQQRNRRVEITIDPRP
ncbi:OmpA family protein [Leptolyngbya sp. CCY15150]|uniref:OmpA family protein n=1 Tax=Leptolyngbya sp. CCY15150 TaxID=2767772 RepID=UPI0019510555|nr:OmpA family protein [Leptolyngbya sp. CCY15150]